MAPTARTPGGPDGPDGPDGPWMPCGPVWLQLSSVSDFEHVCAFSVSITCSVPWGRRLVTRVDDPARVGDVGVGDPAGNDERHDDRQT